jgi:membrane-bound lytic murein transglycosylase B
VSVAQAFRPAQETRPSFNEWLAGVRAEALSRGISQTTIDAALSNIDEPLPVVIERDRAQAEVVQSFEHYITRHVSAKAIKTGREMLARHRALLDEVSRDYGVPPGIILGIWGMESNYGRFSGVRPTIAALATLAWDPRRSAFFRGELFDALAILDRGDTDLAHLKGSWAGAMGQVQFMPSSYLAYAEDFDGDGRRDIWSSTADVFASIANYLAGHGWRGGEAWGREVVVSPELEKKIRADVPRRNGSCQATRDMTAPRPLEAWQTLGVRLPNSRALPKSDRQASLVSGAKRHFLVYENYDALLEYNCAHSYALSVALLADRIGVQSKSGR